MSGKEAMTVIDLDERRPTATSRLVEVALRLERDDNVDRWELADATLAAVEERLPDAGTRITTSHARTGLFLVLDELRDELRQAGARHVAGKRTMRDAYATAAAWPTETRVEGANYWAHFELRGSKWTNRQRILQRLVTDLRRTDPLGTIGTPDVRLRKSDETKPDLRPRDEKLDAALRLTLHRWASPQKFTQLHDDEQDTAVRLLEGLAREIRNGTFE